jgi:hypothetical protein
VVLVEAHAGILAHVAREGYASQGAMYLGRRSAPPPLMTYLIVGLDQNTLARWHENVLAADVGTATQIARARAAAAGIELVVAAVVGPYSCVLSDPAEERAASSQAA